MAPGAMYPGRRRSMAMLVQKGSEVCVALGAHVLVGRSSACAVRLEEPRASAEHARFEHRDGAWRVRDLGSRNGTFVNGERLERGGARVLAAGDELTFGGPQATWVLRDLSPPVALARRLPDGEVFAANAGLLPLPPIDDPAACLVEAEDGRWTVEVDGTARLAVDGEVLSIAGQVFMVHLPTALAATVQEEMGSAPEDGALLELRVSPDEETVEVTLHGPDGARVVSPRAHHYTLLVLARLRLRDREAASLAEPQRGWVSVDELCRMLHVDEAALNVAVFRIRRDLAAQGLANAAQLIERRRGSRQLRLGTERVQVGPLR
jgi:hypothetical protein